MNEPEKTDAVIEETPISEPENNQPKDEETPPVPPAEETKGTGGADAAPETEAVDPPGPVDPPAATSPEGSKPDPAAEVETLKARLLTAMAQNAALRIGVEPARVELTLKLADLSGVDTGAEDAPAKVEAALRRVLQDVPEFAVSKDTGAAGGHRRDTGAEAAKEAAAQCARRMGVVL